MLFCLLLCDPFILLALLERHLYRRIAVSLLRLPIHRLCPHCECISFLALVFELAEFHLKVMRFLVSHDFFCGLFFDIIRVRDRNSIGNILAIFLTVDGTSVSKGPSGLAVFRIISYCIRFHLAQLPDAVINFLVFFVLLLIDSINEELACALALVQSAFTSFRERRLQINIVKLLFQALDGSRCAILSVLRRDTELRSQLLDLVLSTSSLRVQFSLRDLLQYRQRVLLHLQQIVLWLSVLQDG